MWTIIKFDNKKYHLLKKELKTKLGEKCKIYKPKVLINRFINKKLVKKEINLLGNYLFCFDESFKNNSSFKKINYFIGLKYFLKGHLYSQEEIINFINKFKKLENENGFITQPIFEKNINKFYKFDSGSFASKIFKVLSLNKNNLRIIMGNLKSTINRKKFNFSSL